MQKFYRRLKNEKKFKVYDTIAIVTIKKNNKKSLRHILIKIKMSIKMKTTTFDTIMNNKTIRNFMSQLKIQKLNFSFFVEMNVRLCTINDTLLHVYEEHDLRVNVTNAHEKTKKFIQQIIEIDIKDVNIILKLF